MVAALARAHPILKQSCHILRPLSTLSVRLSRAPRLAFRSIPLMSARNMSASYAGVQELDPDLESLITAIHASPTKAVLSASGGAAQAASWLLSVPGASNTVIEAITPYARESLISFLGEEPEQYCSEATAVLMAQAAYRRASVLAGLGTSFVGVGATCALASVPMKRGAHRAFISCHGSFGTKTVSLTFAKGDRRRMGEDHLASRAYIRLLAECMGISSEGFALPLLEKPRSPGGLVDIMEEVLVPAADPIEQLLARRIRCVEFGPGGRVVVDAPRTHKVILPGSFNPLHDGHKQMLRAAMERFGGADMEGCFELSVGNADKGMLTAEEVRHRVTQFTSAGLPLLLTAAPLFTEKAKLLRHCKFVVGFDTAIRMVMPKYYGDSTLQMMLDFASLRMQGCSLVVAGRKDAASGAFKGLSDVAVPPELADLFEGLPEDAFRIDVSSTELRQKMAEAHA